VFGLYGTNFQHIWLLHQRWGYLIALVGVTLVEVFLWFCFRRRGWL